MYNQKQMRKQIFVYLAIFLFLAIGTTLVILYGSGYRFGLEKGRPELSGTGLLVVTSNPDGAQVSLNGHLSTATDNTLNLSPGDYNIRIFKEGYFPWEKRLKIQKEVVAKADALLFPTAPKLESITASGVENPSLDPSQTKIAYVVSSQTTRKNGVYVLDMSSRPILTLQSASVQIADDTVDALSKATLSWSPDGKELVATLSANSQNPTTYLLNANGFNQDPKDVTETLASVQSLWENDKKDKDKSRINALKPALQKIISQNFKIISWSPDETKILYEASVSAEIALIIKPRLIGTDSTPEERSIKKDFIYVYDIKEDKNFKLFDSLSSNTNEQFPLNWFPNSKNIIYVHDKKIDIMEYDGKNITTVYAGPFVDNYVFPWPNASKMVVLTNLGNPSIPPNLYTIGLK